MGWHSAPILADLYVFHTIKKHTVNRSTIGSGFYSRFLDDGLVMLPTTKMAEKLLEREKIVNPILKYTHEIGRTANFLDIFLKSKNYQILEAFTQNQHQIYWSFMPDQITLMGPK